MKPTILAIAMALSTSALADIDNPTPEEVALAWAIFDAPAAETIEFCLTDYKSVEAKDMQECVKFVYRGAARYIANYYLNQGLLQAEDCTLDNTRYF